MRSIFLVAACILPLTAMAIQIQLTPSVPSPRPVGTSVTWTATATDPNPGLLDYRYTVTVGGASAVLKDYSQANSFVWAGSVSEGRYSVQVTVRNSSTGETVQTAVPFTLSSRVVGNTPTVSASANPLVALFSAPACTLGSKMRIQFGTPRGVPDYTDWRSCEPFKSMNVYVAGMRANTPYVMTAQTLTSGTITSGPTLPFTTGTAVANLPTITIPLPSNSQSSKTDNVLVTDFVNLGGSGFPMATDLSGHPVWYYAAFNDPSQAGGLLTRVVPGGSMLVLANGPNSTNATTQLQILREIDLAGNSLRETNATRIQEQLSAMGLQSSCVLGSSVCVFGAFHHEAMRLPNGNTMTFGVVERIFPAGTQGSTGPVDIIGDIIVELDANFQVVWYWNSFDHFDINRRAILNETCFPGFAACPPMYLASLANDWLHANSLQYTADHNLYMSLRHQDWVIKIDYQDGAGTGNIVWRLGNAGDFSLVASDPSPWFSHQHDAAAELNGTFTVFDDGNTRVVQNPGVTENSRGQAYLLDETNRIATQILNSDLGLYSFALGSAQLLSNGNYHFLPGYNNPGPSQFSQSIEVLPTGVVNFRLQSPAPAYRSFRMKNLYFPPNS